MSVFVKFCVSYEQAALSITDSRMCQQMHATTVCAMPTTSVQSLVRTMACHTLTYPCEHRKHVHTHKHTHKQADPEDTQEAQTSTGMKLPLICFMTLLHCYYSEQMNVWIPLMINRLQLQTHLKEPNTE